MLKVKWKGPKMSVDFLVKMRDAATMIADACNEELEKIAPSSIKYNEEAVNKLPWETKTGSKGEYQQTSKQTTNNHPDFQALQAIVKKKNGFCILGGYKYWQHQGATDIIDRRRR